MSISEKQQRDAEEWEDKYLAGEIEVLPDGKITYYGRSLTGRKEGDPHPKRKRTK